MSDQTTLNAIFDNAKQAAEKGANYLKPYDRGEEVFAYHEGFEGAGSAHLWALLGNTPVDDGGFLLEAFLTFPQGTHREDIWLWLEERDPGFSVAKAVGV